MPDLRTMPSEGSMAALRERFAKAKQRLRAALGASFIEVGDALLEMQQVNRDFGKTEEGKAAWLDLTGCDTFEQYVRLEYQIAKSRAYQLMQAREVYRTLQQSPQFVDATLPVNEGQCRWLTQAQAKGRPLVQSPDRLAKAWSDILERYEDFKARKAAEGKKVSPHPPASFIAKHLAKRGYLAGASFLKIADRDHRLVASTIRRLSGGVGALQRFRNLNEDKIIVADVAARENWTGKDKEQFLEQLNEAADWIGRIKRAVERLEL